MSEQNQRIAEYARKLNQTIDEEELFEAVVELAVDRILIYLNAPTLDEKLERIVGQIVAQSYNQASASLHSSGADRAISSVSDNGQSISYANEAQNYMVTADDQALFGGFAALLARYRRLDVVA